MNTVINRKPLTQWLDYLARFLVGGLFLYAVTYNALHLGDFNRIIAAYGFLPDITLPFISITLLSLGLLAGTYTLLGKQNGFLLAGALLLILSAVSVYGIAIGLDIDCGCYSSDDPEYLVFSNLRSELIRNMTLIVPIIFSYWFASQQINLEK